MIQQIITIQGFVLSRNRETMKPCIVISLKCQPKRIENLKAQNDCIGNPYNESSKHWIGVNPATASDKLLKELTRNSYEIVKTKYRKAAKTVLTLRRMCRHDGCRDLPFVAWLKDGGHPGCTTHYPSCLH